MSHNLARIDGRISLAYQGVTPWHALGTTLTAGDNVGLALQQANLADWALRPEPLYLADGRVVSSRRAVVRGRDDCILSTVGADYHILPNEDAFAPLQTALTKHRMTVEVAGAIGQGERVWMLIKMHQSLDVAPGDAISGYLLCQTSHDESNAYEASLTAIRVVCQNTLTAATNAAHAGVFKFRHARSIVERAADAEQMIDRLCATLAYTGETFRQLAQRSMTRAEVSAYIDAVFPVPANLPLSQTLADRRATVEHLVSHGTGATGDLTAWHAYNAVTEYMDHVRPGLAIKDTAKTAANVSALFGGNALIKAAALSAARALVTA